MPPPGLATWLVPLQDGFEPVLVPAPGTSTVGRKATCGLVVGEAYAYVSGEHCRIRITDEGEVHVEDLSANGTFVNGSRIGKDKSVLARGGDEISLAKPTRRGGALKFVLKEAPPGSTPGASASPASNTGVLTTAAPVDTAAGIAAPASAAVASASAAAPAAAAAVAAQPAAAAAAAPAASAAPAAAPPPAAAAPAVPQALGEGGDAATATAAGAASSLAAALAAEERKEKDELTWTLGRVEEDLAKAAQLSAELREVQSRLQQERARQQTNSKGAVPAGALAEANARIADECSELRERLGQMREEAAKLDLTVPAAEAASLKERRECMRLRSELESERGVAERAEMEAAKLRAKHDEATVRTNELRAEVAVAAARNNDLEEQIAEALADGGRARQSHANAKTRLESRTAALSYLRGAVKDHARKVAERLGVLEASMDHLPASISSSAPGDVQSQAVASQAASGSPTDSMEVLRHARGVAEDPTIAYATHDLAGGQEAPPPGHGTVHRGSSPAGAPPVAKRRRVPAEDAQGPQSEEGRSSSISLTAPMQGVSAAGRASAAAAAAAVPAGTSGRAVAR